MKEINFSTLATRWSIFPDRRQLTTLFNLFLSLTDDPICLFFFCFFSVKPSVLLYSDRKPRACQKLENGPGVGKFPAPGPCKATDKAGKCPAVARGRGVAGRNWN